MALRLTGQTSGYVELEAPAVAGSNTLTLPDGNGSSGQVLSGDGSGALSWTTPVKTDTAQTFTAEQTFDAGLTVDSAYAQASQAMAALDVDCSTGNYFTKSISTSSTITFSNIPASGTAFSFTLELALSGASTAITWPAAVRWNADTAPTITDGRTHLFLFTTSDGGTTIRGAALVDYTA